MTVKLNEIRLMGGTPIRCSACFQQESKHRHVDFDAACDRGYGESEDNPGLKVPMDNLFLCQSCVAEGARLIGMVDAAGSAAELNRLRLELANQSERREHFEELSKRLERVLDMKPKPSPLKGREIGKRSPESIAKQKATIARKREEAA